jgi:hypothetical protein
MYSSNKTAKTQAPAPVVKDPEWLERSVLMSYPDPKDRAQWTTSPIGLTNLMRRKNESARGVVPPPSYPRMIRNETAERFWALAKYLPACTASECDKNSNGLCDLCQRPHCAGHLRGYRTKCQDLATPLQLCEECKPVARIWPEVIEDRLAYHERLWADKNKKAAAKPSPIVDTRGYPVADRGGVLGRIARSMKIGPSKIVDEKSFKSAQFFVNRWLKHRRRKIAVGLARQKMAAIQSSQATGSIRVEGIAAPDDFVTIGIGDEFVEHVFTEPTDIAGVTAVLWHALNASDRIKGLVILRNPACGLIQLASQQLGSAGCHTLEVHAAAADLKLTVTADHLVLPQLLMPLVDGGYVAPNGDLLTLRTAMPIVTEDAALAAMLIETDRAVVITLEDLKGLPQ